MFTEPSYHLFGTGDMIITIMDDYGGSHKVFFFEFQKEPPRL